MPNLFRAVFAPPRDLILLLAAGWLGLTLADRRARRIPGDAQAQDSLTTVMIIAFVLGGRLLFAAGHMAAFSQSPLSLVSLNIDLFDTWGALACAAIAGTIVLQRKGMQGWHALDLLTPLFGALAIGLGLAHLASGAAFGRETDIPWAIVLWGAPRHPTQIYEVIVASLALAIVWSRDPDRQPGGLFLLWAALMAGSRLILEAFRGDSTLVFGGLRLAQIIAWIVLAAALIGMELRRCAVLKKDGMPVQTDAVERKRTVPEENRAL